MKDPQNQGVEKEKVVPGNGKTPGNDKNQADPQSSLDPGYLDYLYIDDSSSVKIHATERSTLLRIAREIPGLRVVPTGRDKKPLVSGWSKGEYWNGRDAVSDINLFNDQFKGPNFAFALGEHCGPGGNLVLEADNDAGELWLEENCAPTPIMVQARNGRFHRHYAVPPGNAPGNYTDILGSNKKWIELAEKNGYRITPNKRKMGSIGYELEIFSEIQRAEKDIPRGPVIDIKSTGGICTAPGSIHLSGHIYTEPTPWTLELWNNRPVFQHAWFPSSIWSARANNEMLSGLDSAMVPYDRKYWTAQRRKSAAMKYIRHVPPVRSGQGIASRTAMRTASVLVRGFMLDRGDALELMKIWGQQTCRNEPWSDKELLHKVNQAFKCGTCEWGSFLRKGHARVSSKYVSSDEMINTIRKGYSEMIREPDFQEETNKSFDKKAIEAGMDYEKTIEPFQTDCDKTLANISVSDATVPTELDVEIIAKHDCSISQGASMTTAAQSTETSTIKPKPAVSIPMPARRASPAPIKRKRGRPTKASAKLQAQEEASRPQVGLLKDMVDENYEALYVECLAAVGIDVQDILNDENPKFPTMKLDKDGDPIEVDFTTPSIVSVLKYSSHLKEMRFSANAMGEILELNGKPLTDDALNDIRIELCEIFGKEVPADRAFSAVRSLCAANAREPVQEYLNSLPAWDGIKRWEKLPEEVLHVDPSEVPFARSAIRRYGISAVARAMNPGEKADLVLVLKSNEQGMHKSAFGRNLFGKDFYTDQRIDIYDKDSRLVMAQFWAIEMGEGEVLSDSKQAKQFKAFISQQSDVYRKPYGKVTESVPRRCVMLVTTNESRPLTDKSGNRRFIVVTPSKKININKLNEWRDQLWAEALHCYILHKSAEMGSKQYEDNQWWPTEEEEKINQIKNDNHIEEDPWQEDVRLIVDRKTEPFILTDILREIGLDIKGRGTAAGARVTRILEKLGFSRYKNRRVNGIQGRYYDPKTRKLPEPLTDSTSPTVPMATAMDIYAAARDSLPPAPPPVLEAARPEIDLNSTADIEMAKIRKELAESAKKPAAQVPVPAPVEKSSEETDEFDPFAPLEPTPQS